MTVPFEASSGHRPSRRGLAPNPTSALVGRPRGRGVPPLSRRDQPLPSSWPNRCHEGDGQQHVERRSNDSRVRAPRIARRWSPWTATQDALVAVDARAFAFARVAAPRTDVWARIRVPPSRRAFSRVPRANVRRSVPRRRIADHELLGGVRVHLALQTRATYRVIPRPPTCAAVKFVDPPQTTSAKTLLARRLMHSLGRDTCPLNLPPMSDKITWFLAFQHDAYTYTRPTRFDAGRTAPSSSANPLQSTTNDSRTPTRHRGAARRTTAGRATRAQPSTDPRKQHERRISVCVTSGCRAARRSCRDAHPGAHPCASGAA
jgi:hypothetical protein